MLNRSDNPDPVEPKPDPVEPELPPHRELALEEKKLVGTYERRCRGFLAHICSFLFHFISG